jgi:HD-GYP domain-containing protein (c-di-GMP phosphodiesterase class II)
LSEYALTGTVLTRDLHDATGRLVASRGEIVDLMRLKRACQRAPRDARQRPLHETGVSTAVLEAFEAPALAHVVQGDARAQVADTMCEVRFPDVVWAELDVLGRDDAARYQHAVWTAVVSARLFRAALGEAPGLSRLAGGALVHDVGMRYASPRLRSKRDFLTQSEALMLEEHPFIGALLLASALGESPAVHFALLHHTRSGRGYPRIDGRPPLRGLDLVAVASAFAALIAPRPFRQKPFDARGAGDQLCEEAEAGFFDPRAVRLLIHCLRGAKGDVRGLRLPKRATGFRPETNKYGLSVEARVGA